MINRMVKSENHVPLMFQLSVRIEETLLLWILAYFSLSIKTFYVLFNFCPFAEKLDKE